MSLKVGIVGLPNVGKSTLFKALTKHPVDINNYPFCTIEPNIGVVQVPDARLDKLAAMSQSQNSIPAVVEFVDIAGLVKGASEGEGLGNKFLANIREVDAIVHVVRVFENSQISHVHDVVDPLRDIDIINTELILADLETVKSRREKLAKEAKAGDKGLQAKLVIVERIEKKLSEGELARDIFSLEERNGEFVQEVLGELHLLTGKPMLFVYNISDFEAKLPEELSKRNHVRVDIKIEEELLDMGQEDMKELGLNTQLNALIREAYEILGLITYFTTGEKESRAWTIVKDSTAPQAGAAIHSDFEEKFIRAEVITWDKLLEAGSWSIAREKGWLRLEGKEYIVQDGDVMEFKI